jgi:hypothetical protein
LLKDFFILAFAITSIAFLKKSTLTFPNTLFIPALLAVLIAFSFIQSIYLYGTWVAVAGLRPMAYLAGGFLGVWAVKRSSLELLCRYLVAILIVELILALYEYRYGIPLFSTARLSNRINGTFSFPTSLGIFTVIVYSLAMSFSNINRPFLLALTLLLVYLTGSATALILLAVALAIWAANSVPDSWKIIVRLTSIGLITIILLSLPKMVARPDVLNSLWGRIEPASDYIDHSPPLGKIIFGKGLGIGSNLVNSVVNQSDTDTEPEGVDLYHARADSTPLALLNQLGIVGVSLFYLTMALAVWRDRPLFPVYAVLFLASITTNLLELFPVNFLLGLLLCRSILYKSERLPG